MPTEVSDEEIITVLNKLNSEGLTGRILIDKTVELTGLPKNRVYRLSIGKY